MQTATEWLVQFNDWDGGADEARALTVAAAELIGRGEIHQTKAFHTAIDYAKRAAGHELGSLDERVRLGFVLIEEEVREVNEAATAAELAKELADLIFVALQLAHFYGFPMEEVYAEVLRSNVSKLQGATFREDGKLCKGPNYSPANVSDVLEREGWGL